MTAGRYIDPRHGTHAPTTGTPARRPGSVRRTTTVDALRRGAVDAGLFLVGRARDLVTDTLGTPSEVATATMEVDLAYTGGAVVQSIRTTPCVGHVEALVGKVATTGFRAVIDDATEAVRGSLVYLLLDEIPVSTLVSGYAVGHAAQRGDIDPDALTKLRRPGIVIHGPDACAGFQIGGVINTAVHAGDAAAVTGPDATPLADPADPVGWHQVPPLEPDAMRRWRRHDLWYGDDGLLHVDVLFRDSHMDPDGLETIIHEYTVDATIDPATMRVVACEAVPRVLPWRECPEAAASAGRLEGMSVMGLRPQVRAELLGRTTCTHLNDTLRELEDVVSPATLLPAATPA